ncbi:MAG TPA: hypothetical protein V6C52_14135 [Coleofasciculaceae cyanobacterium]|jgi:hypothetical protein
MGQNAPLSQQNNPWGKPGLAQTPTGSGQSPFALPGVDPRMAQTILSQLSNPNAGDSMTRTQPAQNLPGAGPGGPATPPPTFTEMMEEVIPLDPRDIAAGGATGIGAALGLSKLQERGTFARVADKLDKLPVLDKISHFIENKITPRLRGKGWFDELSPKFTPGLGKDEAVKAALEKLQARHIDATMERIAKRAEQGGIWKKLHAELTSGASKTNFQQFLDKADQKLEALASKSGKDKAEKLALIELRRARRLVNSQMKHHLPHIEPHYKMLFDLGKKGTGPLGKAFTSTMNIITRIMGGETMMTGLGMSAKPTSSLFGKLALPFINGWMIIGLSYKQARKAQEGEKTKTFFHSMLGFGIANFVGWELGRRWLRSMGLQNKIFGKFSGGSPLFFLRWIPKLGPWLTKLTLGGFATEMIAALVIGGLFQKAGEWVSHKIFGTPSEASLNPDKFKKAPPLPSGDHLRDGKVFNQFAKGAAMQSAMPSQANAAMPSQANATIPPLPSSLSPDQIAYNPIASSPQSPDNAPVADPEPIGDMNAFLPPEYRTGGTDLNVDPYSEKGMLDPFKSH